MRKRLPWIAVLLSLLLAFAFRVVPSWGAVFTTHGISFQEPDAWFHMRTVHNLLAHFPSRSGFDPYALYPGGANVTTGPFWDYLIGTTAWIVGAGSPSDGAVDLVGAWLPVILGSLFPVLVFLFVRRLFGTDAAVLGAFWVAIIPGTFLWVSHLGMADHHAAEAFTSFLALTLLCAAAETQGRIRWAVAVLSGLALAAYLTTRAAGVFVPAILTVAAMVNLELAPVAAVAIGTAFLMFLVVPGGSPWSNFTLLSLVAGLAITLPLALLSLLARRRHWSRKTIFGTAVVLALVCLACVAVLEASKIRALLLVIQHYLPGRSATSVEGAVKELQPLWIASPGGFKSLFGQFGAAWIFAIPGLAGLVWMACRTRRPAIALFTVWSCAMILGVILQLRMAAYAGFVVAILAGATTAWIVAWFARSIMLRGLVTCILLAIALGIALPIGFAESHPTGGPDLDWSAALDWLRWHTPEPMGDPAAWYRWWPRLAPGTTFTYPASTYGIFASWDKGWWITAIARRIPSANGEQEGAIEVSRFFTETASDRALQTFRQTGARYVAIGPGPVTFELPALVSVSGRQIDQYSRLFYLPASTGKRVPVRVYLPAFYHSMAARLYLFDGRPVETKARGVQVFLTAPYLNPSGVTEETIQSVRHFATQKEAEQWMAQNQYETSTLASSDATVSCVDLEPIPWLKPVFASNADPIIGNKQPSVVKIFQVAP